jgi:hypothetical protein
MSLQKQAASTSAKNQKTRVLEYFDNFRTSSDERRARYPAQLLELPEEVVTSRELWDDFASWLVDEFIIAGKPRAAAHGARTAHASMRQTLRQCLPRLARAFRWCQECWSGPEDRQPPRLSR